MPADALPWPAIVLAVIGAAVIVLLLRRYRRLERDGTPLPPGAGGARLVGVESTLATDHDPRGAPGTVHVLGDVWLLSDAVVIPIPAGRAVRVTEVVGTRLVVTPVADDSTPPSDLRTRSDADPDPDAPFDGDRPSPATSEES